MFLAGRFDTFIEATTVTVHQATAEANISGVLWNNDASGPMFMQIFDATASDVTPGTTVPDMTLQLASTAAGEANFHGAKFETGMAFAVTTIATGSLGSGGTWVTVVYV